MTSSYYPQGDSPRGWITNCITERRFGIIRIQTDLLNGCTPFALREFWSNFCPLRMEHHAINDVFVIEAASDLFDMVPLGEQPPEYTVEVTRTEYPSGAIAVTYEYDDQKFYNEYKATRL